VRHTAVLTPEITLDVQALTEYSPLYIPGGLAMTYMISFILSTCILVHTLLHHGPSIWGIIDRTKPDVEDIHSRLMKNYRGVPDWWYAALFLLFFLMAVVAIEVWHNGMPVYALVLSLLLPTVYIIPNGLILATTGLPVNINVLAEIIPGVLIPGNPLVNMLFKSFVVQTLVEAETFMMNLKLGHYLKVPPRATFIVQLVETAIAACVQTGVMIWLFAGIPDICTSDQKDHLTCPKNGIFFTASAVWGLIGPNRLFGRHALYNWQLYGLLIGAFLPFPFWIWCRKFPQTRLRFVSIPLLLVGISQTPPAGINFSSWFATGFVFQYLIKKRNFAWWTKYNYLTSAGLDCGTFLAIIAIFFCLQYPKGGLTINWWGNTIWQNTADAMSLPFRQVPPGGIPRSM